MVEEKTLFSRQEQLVRKVSNFGNGAHVFIPKEWMNEEVLVVRLEKKTIKQQILEILSPNLEKVIGVFLYGSQARGENNENSDVDLFVIAKERFKIEKKIGYDILILTEEEIEKAIRINPILMYSIFREAEPIINSSYHKKLEKYKVESKNFKRFLEQTKESIKSSEELLELDKKTGKFASNSVVYSLILRLRGIFIVNALLEKKRYYNLNFRKFILSKNIDFDKVYLAYQAVRANKKIKETVLIAQVELLMDLLKNELDELSKKIK